MNSGHRPARHRGGSPPKPTVNPQNAGTPDSSEIYERNINVSVSRTGDREIVTKATMLDLNHHIRVELTIDLVTRSIVGARAQMTKVPYSICQLTLSNIEKLMGLKIERGIHGEIVDRLGHSDGCTHMVDLAMEAVRLSANVMVGLIEVGPEWFDPGDLSEEQMIKRVKPILKNTCLPFKESS